MAPGEIASTDALCNGQGIEFVPVVIESHGGGWGREARDVFRRMARHLAAAQRPDEETTGLQTAQRIPFPFTGKTRGPCCVAWS